MFKVKDKVNVEYDKRELTESGKEINKDGSLQVDMETKQLDEKDKTNNDQQKKSAIITYKQLSNEYILQEGYEREWIEKVKLLINNSNEKTLDESLRELMPLARYHKDIRNALKAKRMAIQHEDHHESIHVFLDKLSQIYGSSKSKVSKQKSIRCYKCHKRGHDRKHCLNFIKGEYRQKNDIELHLNN